MTEGFSIEELSRDETSRTFSARALASAPFFKGHFPGNPILPGVAQLSELALPLARAAWPELPPLRRVTRLKFHRLVRPEEPLTVRVARTSPRRVEFSIAAGAEPVSAGAMDFGDPP